MRRWDFWDWCLAGIVVFGLALGLVTVAAYALPRAPLVVPELQRAVRVGRIEDFPPNTARLERWGRELILVIRTADGELHAVEGVSPTDGCVLGWDADVQHVVSPCTHLEYSPVGGVVVGLSNQPLATYPVQVRDGTVYVGRHR